MYQYHNLETERLLLKPSTIADSAFVFELLNSPSWIKYIGNRNILTIEDAKAYILNKMTCDPNKLGVNYTVSKKIDGQKIGSCGLYKRDSLDDPDIGFAFLPEHEGLGYGLESASAVLQMGIDNLKISRICAITTEDNTSSRNLLEKLGLTFQKTIRIPNENVDLLLYFKEIDLK